MGSSSFAGVAWAGGSAALLVILLLVAQRWSTVSTASLLSLPYESGWAPQEHALSRFHARWYPMTLVFLAFDVEMLFMYPWSLVVAEVGWSAVIEMFTFLGGLMIAVVWARREGAFRWA